MSSLHERLVANTDKPSCKLCKFLDTLPYPEMKSWQHELSLPVTEVGNIAVVCELWERGVYVTEASVRRHRKNHAV